MLKKTSLLLTTLAIFFLLISLFFYVEKKENFLSFDLIFNERNIPFVKVVVNGESLDAMLDLGAEVMMAVEGAVPSSAYSRTDQKTTLQSIDSQEELEILNLNEINLGHVKFRNVPFCITSNDSHSTYTPVGEKTELYTEQNPKLILGNNLFKGMILMIDYRQKKCFISDNLQTLIRKGLVDSAFLKGELLSWNQHFLIKSAFEGEEKKLFIDTGSTYNFLFTPNDGNALHMSPVVSEILNWEGHEFFIGKTYQINRELSPFIDGILGGAFLEQHQIVLDPINKTCWIKPNS